MPEQFYDRVVEAMEDKHLNACQLAKKLNVSTTSTDEWLNSYRVMSVVNFFNLCKVLDVSPLYLYGISEER